MYKFKNQKGFSLIELLVVIAIILLLAAISIVALNGQKAKARDANRISDVKRIKTALEYYYSNEKEYPLESQPIILGSENKNKLCAKVNGGFVSAQTDCGESPVYMAQVPKDPLSNQHIFYTGTQDGYDIAFTMEKPSELGPAATYHAHSQTIDNYQMNK